MRGGHGVLAFVVIVSAFIHEAYSAACTYSSTLKPFRNFSTSAVSAQGQLPPAGSCVTWPITIIDGTSSCSEPNGTMLFELFVTDSNWNVIDPQRTVSGLYFMAAQTQPTVSHARLCEYAHDVYMACWYIALIMSPCLLDPSGFNLWLLCQLLPDSPANINLTSKPVQLPVSRLSVDLRPEADVSVHDPRRVAV